MKTIIFIYICDVKEFFRENLEKIVIIVARIFQFSRSILQHSIARDTKKTIILRPDFEDFFKRWCDENQIIYIQSKQNRVIKPYEIKW